MFIVSISIYLNNKHIENTLKSKDKKLGEYYFESVYQRNDGWWMKHYRELYENRLKELKQKRNAKPTRN